MECHLLLPLAMSCMTKLPLPPRSQFISRLLRNVVYALLIIFVSLVVGMCGYHFIEGLSWVDAYLNATMILSGMGPVNDLHTEAGKLFAGTYALYSGFSILIVIGFVLAPVAHRFLHKFHLDTEQK